VAIGAFEILVSDPEKVPVGHELGGVCIATRRIRTVLFNAFFVIRIAGVIGDKVIEPRDELGVALVLDIQDNKSGLVVLEVDPIFRSRGVVEAHFLL